MPNEVTTLEPLDNLITRILNGSAQEGAAQLVYYSKHGRLNESLLIKVIVRMPNDMKWLAAVCGIIQLCYGHQRYSYRLCLVLGYKMVKVLREQANDNQPRGSNKAVRPWVLTTACANLLHHLLKALEKWEEDMDLEEEEELHPLVQTGLLVMTMHVPLRTGTVDFKLMSLGIPNFR